MEAAEQSVVVNWIVAAALAVSLVVWVRLHRVRQRHSRDPKTWPFIGAQAEVFLNFHRLHDWILSFFSLDHQTVKLDMVFGSIFLTVDPRNVEHILKSSFPNYPKGPVLHRQMYDFLGDGIFTSDGETWKKHRKVASLEFSNKKLRDFSTESFKDGANSLIQILHSTAASQTIVDLQDLFMRMTLDSICKVGFGVHVGSLSPSLPDVPFGRAFDTVNEICTARVFNPFRPLQKALHIGRERILYQEMKILNSFTEDIVKTRRAELLTRNSEWKPDLLSRFMTYNEGSPDAFNDKELRDAILNFVIAGRDTSAITLSWFIFCVCNHPHVAERVLTETVKVLGLQENKKYSSEEILQRISYETLNKMHYLHAALTETLRLYPAVPRDAKYVAGDDILPDGTCLKRGNRIAYIPYSMGRMEFLWGKDALTYNPDRWLKDEVFQPESPFKFTAFQAGPRVCLGKESAYLQMKITAAVLLYFFTFHIVPGHVVKYRMMLVMPMANGLRVQVSHK